MPVDNMAESYKPPVTEASIPVDVLPATSENISQILIQAENGSPQETFQKLSLLKEIPKNQAGSLPTVVQPETPIDGPTQDKIQKLREDIRSFSAQGKNTPESASSDNPYQIFEIKPKKVKTGFIEGIKNRYAEKQRQKVEYYKNLIESDFNYSYSPEENLPKEKPLSTIKQFWRILLDTRGAGIILPRLQKNSHEQQQLEAEYTAAREYYKERSLSLEVEKQSETAKLRAKEELEKKSQIAKAIEAARLEKEEFENDLLNGMNNYRNRRSEKIRQERVQEIVERIFNKQLTKLEDIDAQSSAEESGVTKRQYDDVIIYDMRGYQFRFLLHSINFKYGSIDFPNQNHLIGSETAKELIDDPSLWKKPETEIGKTGGWDINSKSNVICTSYISGVNLKNWGTSLVYYGFEDILPGSLIQSIPGDGGTHNHIEKDSLLLHTNPKFIGTPEQLETSESWYNEVDIRRYDSNGKPKLPTYLIVKNWNFRTEAVKNVFLTHARYFHIPIINIETQFYGVKE